MIPKNKHVIVVPTAASLGIGLRDNEVKYVLDSGIIYKWNATSSEWEAADTGGELEYTLIQGGL